MTVATVTVEEAAAWLQAGEAVLIDVREPDEFAAARIESAIGPAQPDARRLGGAEPSGRRRSSSNA